MALRCPGQDFRWLKVEEHECGRWIYKEKLPSCVDWCSAARECIGEERWKQANGCEESGA